MHDPKEYETHESWAVASFSRCSGHVPLFATNVDGESFVTLTISRAYRYRNLASYWVHSDQELIEVAMSSNQFANLITTMNQGVGEPCTILHLNGKSVERPVKDHLRETFDTEFKAECQKVASRGLALKEEVGKILEKPTITKKDRQEILSKIQEVLRPIYDSMPFVQQQFTEAMNGVVTEAKAEVEAFVEGKVRSLGIEKLDEVVKALSAPASSPVLRLEAAEPVDGPCDAE